MSFGADDYITKPFSAADLIKAIDKRLQKFDLLKNARLAEIDELRTYLNTTLPHELRTPLTGLMGYIDWLLADFDNLDSTEVKRVLGRLNHSANRLYRLIENHLLHTQLKSALKDNDFAQRLLRFGGCETPETTLHAAAQRLAYKYNRQADLTINTKNASVSIFTDHLQKLIEELMDNACKFSSAGSPIYITAAPTAQHYTIILRDHGRGINPEYLDQIGPNRQFDRRKYEQQGTGLGLAIARQITHLYRGEVNIDSTLDKGTTVNVYLPLLTDKTE